MSRSQRDWRRDSPGRAPLGNTARTVAPPPIDSPPAFRAVVGEIHHSLGWKRICPRRSSSPTPSRSPLYYCTHTLARGRFNVKVVCGTSPVPSFGFRRVSPPPPPPREYCPRRKTLAGDLASLIRKAF